MLRISSVFPESIWVDYLDAVEALLRVGISRVPTPEVTTLSLPRE